MLGNKGGGGNLWSGMLSEVGGVGEVIMVAANMLPQMINEKEMVTLLDKGWQLEKWKFC